MCRKSEALQVGDKFGRSKILLWDSATSSIEVNSYSRSQSYSQSTCTLLCCASSFEALTFCPPIKGLEWWHVSTILQMDKCALLVKKQQRNAVKLKRMKRGDANKALKSCDCESEIKSIINNHNNKSLSNLLTLSNVSHPSYVFASLGVGRSEDDGRE